MNESESSRFRPHASFHFESARRQALVEGVKAWFSGRARHLVPFDAVRSQLRQQHPLYKGIQLAPMDKIVGSVGRYQEFTRNFLPLHDNLRERWVGVEAATMARGLPPVELYRVGGLYFVKDGHHRVAIARQMGSETIEAHVWLFESPVEFDPEASLDDLLIAVGRQNFLERSRLHELVPDHDIRFTAPGQYNELLSQIHDLQEKLSQIDGENLPYPEAALAWYEMVYCPAIESIRQSKLLADFPGRTEADLFVWISSQYEELAARHGVEQLDQLTAALAKEHRPGILTRLARKLRQRVTTRQPND
jgi:hypothetical protein